MSCEQQEIQELMGWLMDGFLTEAFSEKQSFPKPHCLLHM